MKKALLAALLAALMLVCTGCASFLERDYSVVQPHSSTYYESEDRSVLRAESYQDLVNDLMLLLTGGAREGTIWLYAGTEPLDASAAAERACKEVQQETPLGAYAVKYLTYTIDDSARNYTAIHLTIGYRRTQEQIASMVYTTSVSALGELLTAAARSGSGELVVQVGYFDHQEEEVRSIVADVRVAGMLTGKTGFVHVHLGDYTSSFDIFDGIVASGLPIKHIRPTHVARHPAVFERAMGFAKQGGWIDITTGGGNYMGCAADAYDMAVENGVPVNRITMSSDGHGSMPRFNEAGEMVGLGVGSIMCNIETVQELARRHDLTTALLPMTRTVAEALTLEGKGVIEVGADADLLILNAEHEITDVFMGGVQCMRAGEVIVKGAFEE